jgi:hypothetical protein
VSPKEKRSQFLWGILFGVSVGLFFGGLTWLVLLAVIKVAG